MTWSELWRDPVTFLRIAVNTRGLRLLLYALLTAALFPSSRFILILVVLTALAVLWVREYRKTHSFKIFALAGAVGLLLGGYVLSWHDVRETETMRLEKSVWGDGIKYVSDGAYVGSGDGFRGPITVRVTVMDHAITGIDTLEYPDLISVKDNEIADFTAAILKSGRLEKPSQPEMFRGGAETLTGYVNAVQNALSKGVPNYPKYNPLTSLYLDAVIGAAPSGVTLNGLAILFAAFLVFEYTLQSMLTPGTGRSINCYNCASCVGVCPVKEVEGVQMPMGLVLLTRLGEYERVMELSKYCVGCGRCAAKCPIGNSGPLVISAAFQACREQRRILGSEGKEQTS